MTGLNTSYIRDEHNKHQVLNDLTSGISRAEMLVISQRSEASQPKAGRDSVRVNAYPHTAIILALTPVFPMNRRIQTKYEGVRVKWRATFF